MDVDAQTALKAMRPGALSSDDAKSSRKSSDRRAGVRETHLLFVLLAAAALLPYLAPASLWRALGIGSHIERFHAYRAGSPPPFTRFLTFRPPTRPTVGGLIERAHSLGDNVLEGAPLLAPGLPAPSAPGGGQSLPASLAALRIPAEVFARLPLPIEDSAGTLVPFYQALRAVAQKESGATARILFFSDSMNGSDRTSDALRRRLQERFGNGGKGFVHLAPGWQSHRHQGIVWESHGFKVEVLNRGTLPSGHYGLGGVLAMGNTESAVASFQVPMGTFSSKGLGFDRVGLLYERWPGGGAIQVQVDDNPPERILTDATTEESAAWAQILTEPGQRVRVTAGPAPVRAFGVTLERSDPGVVVDGLMLIGAFTRVLKNWDAAHWQAQLDARRPSLVLFWVGGNDAAVDGMGFRQDALVDDFAEVLERSRGSQARACLVVSVLDSGREVAGVVQSRRRVPRVVAAQRAAAERSGCAFFDGYRATGGPGTAARWFQHRPRLLAVDYRHLTRSGAEVFGVLLERALLHGYDQWLARGAPSERPGAEATGDGER